MPKLIGLSPDEAASAIASAGYVLGKVDYVVSDVDIGFVCGQYPATGVELKTGETVSISISATSAQGVETPILVGCTLEEALGLLGQAGFTNIRMRDSSALGVPPNLVLSQQPEDHILVQSDALLEMVVSIGTARTCAADIAFNLDIPSNGTPVIVTMPEARVGVAYERVVY
ncbi:MAG TPA: PASTA domain-containing protein, partial [Caldilineaceae bacterium]|nr:PASTA domain-containing protein [Caldilineaceae bacterium]